jgi:hypothetical protein
MMVEGELDALSVIQEAGDLVNCVATGSSGKGRANWVAELSMASVILQSFDEDKAGDDGAEYWLELFKVPDTEPLKIERWSPVYWNDPNDILRAQGQPDSICALREWVQMGVDLARHDIAMINGVNTPLARETVQAVENHFDPADEEQNFPQIEESSMSEQEIKSRILSLAEHIKQHPEEYRRPYVPVSLPNLPRKKCPHQVVSEVRVSDKMTNAKVGSGCKGIPLAHGWCEYHAPAQDFLEIGARIGYPQLFFGNNKARGVEPGLIQWEAYAQTTKPDFLKSDCAVLKVRYNL